MMYRNMLLVSLFIIGSWGLQAQDFVREKDPKTGKVLLHGRLNFDDLKKESSCAWFQQGAQTYQPKGAVIQELKRVSGPYRFIVFAGTWCSDTRDLLPKLYKILKEAQIDEHTVEMYGVNRQKEALNIEHKLYNLINIPTIIVMHQHHEIGRIVESVEGSLEDSLLALMSKDYEALEEARLQKLNR